MHVGESTLAACYWQPHGNSRRSGFRERFEKDGVVPFADYYAGNYISAFNRMIDKTVVFAPLGFCFGTGSYRNRKYPEAGVG